MYLQSDWSRMYKSLPDLVQDLHLPNKSITDGHFQGKNCLWVIDTIVIPEKETTNEH